MLQIRGKVLSPFTDSDTEERAKIPGFDICGAGTPRLEFFSHRSDADFSNLEQRGCVCGGGGGAHSSGVAIRKKQEESETVVAV